MKFNFQGAAGNICLAEELRRGVRLPGSLPTPSRSSEGAEQQPDDALTLLLSSPPGRATFLLSEPGEQHTSFVRQRNGVLEGSLLDS